MHGETAGPATAGAPPAKPRQRRGQIIFWGLFGLAVAAVAAGTVLWFSSVRFYVNASSSMQPTIKPGDRLTVAKGQDVRRGDVIVFTRAGDSLGYVKRVIGLPGDLMQCCNARGQVVVNKKPLNETYINPDGPPSEKSFSVTLSPGQMWVMGDDRTISIDSRSWGPVPTSGIVGRVATDGSRALHTPPTFVTEGLAPSDDRGAPGTLPEALVGTGLTAVVILAVFGTIRFFVRRRRSRRIAPHLR